MKAYTLKSEYEGQLVGATCVAGPDGVSMDVLEALDAGGGRIETDDSMLQSILENLYAADGLLLDVHGVDDEGNLVDLPAEEMPLPQPETAAAQPQDVAAVHGEGGWNDLSREELKEVAHDRGLPFKATASKHELVKLLDEADKNTVAPDQSGESGDS